MTLHAKKGRKKEQILWRRDKGQSRWWQNVWHFGRTDRETDTHGVGLVLVTADLAAFTPKPHGCFWSGSLASTSEENEKPSHSWRVELHLHFLIFYFLRLKKKKKLKQKLWEQTKTRSFERQTMLYLTFSFSNKNFFFSRSWLHSSGQGQNWLLI